ncbi:MAG: Ig-like domain-containing protein, partial [Blastocatellia bacterium]
AGPAPGFVGLDQVNAEIPRSLLGRGRVNLAISALGFSASNLVEVEIAGTTGASPPQVSGFGATPALAGSIVTINGSGFAPNVNDNLARIAGLEARVVAASATQLSVVTPFGAESGAVSVRTPQGEGVSASRLNLRASISGFVETTGRQPLRGVPVKVAGTNITTTTSAEGFFLLPDVAPGVAVIEVDGASAPGPLRYPKVAVSQNARPNRDNQFARPIALQQIVGPSIPVGSPGPTAMQIAAARFEVQNDMSATFPDGATSGDLTLSVIENSRTPAGLPAGQFASPVVQITPFGVRLNPGGRLIFANEDSLPVGAQLQLFRLDQNAGSQTLGRFVEAGLATVVDTGNGTRVQTADGAITETGCFFLALPRLTTTVVGRVVKSDGATPVRQSLVRARGQEAFTDGNGAFVLRHVPVKAGEFITVDASFAGADGRVDRAERRAIPAVAGGITTITPELKLALDEANRPPVILGQTSASLNGGEIRTISFVASDPDIGQPLQVGVSGASFASIIAGANDTYSLRLAPRTSDGGQFTLTITANDPLGASATHRIAVTVNRPPTANAQAVTTDEDTAKQITLAGSDPDEGQLTFIVVSHPAHGRLSGSAPNLSYTPAANYFGSDSFTFKINDGMADSNVATVSIAVNPVNDPPALTLPVPPTILTEEALSLMIQAFDPDEGQTLTITATGAPVNATLAQAAPSSAQFRWTPSATQTGAFTINFRVTDSGSPALSDSGALTVTVLGRWRPTTSIEGGVVNTVFSDGANLFAGTQGGAYRSTNQGQSWSPITVGLPREEYVSTFAVIGSTLFACGHGVYRSTNQGLSWEYAENRVGDQGLPYRIYSLAVIGTTLFGGTSNGGVYRSTDQGNTWVAVNQGLANANVYKMAVFNDQLYAGTNGGGVFRSTNRGDNWTAVNAGLPPQDVYVRDFVTLGGRIFVGTNWGVFVLSANGQSWLPSNSGITNQNISSLGVTGTTLLAGTYGSGLFRSTDPGLSWEPVNAGAAAASVISLAQSGANLLAATYGGGVLRSTDQGRNWTTANSGLTAVSVISLLVDRGTLFAGASGGAVYRTANQGQSWTTASSGLPNCDVRALVLIGANLIAGTSCGVYSSFDQGGSWRETSDGLFNRNVQALAVRGTTLFAGVSGGGVFASFTQGVTWTRPGNVGLDQSVQSLAVSGANLFAGTDRGGLYRSATTAKAGRWPTRDCRSPRRTTRRSWLLPRLVRLCSPGAIGRAFTARPIRDKAGPKSTPG